MRDKALYQQQNEAHINEWKVDIDTLKVKHSDFFNTTDLRSYNDEETLHDIPELEVNNTLIRMDGNIKLLRKLICRFSETQADAVVRIKEALAYDNTENARYEVNALKSFAGMIGATLLEDHAQILENMCENNMVEGRDKAVHNLEIDLTNLLARIYTAYGTQGEH